MIITRRNMLAAGSGLIAANAIAGVSVARAQIVPYTRKLADAEVTVVSDGAMSLPLTFVLPRTEQQDTMGLLGSHGLTGPAYAMQMNITVIKSAGALIVVDSGGGTDFMPGMGQLADRLEQAGFKATDVTHLIMTHAHPDHFWGLIDPLDDDSRFPNARHVMTLAERDHWLKPGIEDNVPDSMKGITLGTVRRLKAVAKRFDFVKAGAEILPGVTLVDTAGHTPGHASVMLSFGGQSLLIGSDALAHAVISIERPDWVWGADFDPQQAIVTRKRLLDQLATDRISLLGYHLPWPGFGRIERKDNGYRYIAA